MHVYISKYFFTSFFEFFPMLEFKDWLKTCSDINFFLENESFFIKSFKKLSYFLMFERDFKVCWKIVEKLSLSFFYFASRMDYKVVF